MIASIRYERNQLKKRLTVPQQETIKIRVPEMPIKRMGGGGVTRYGYA